MPRIGTRPFKRKDGRWCAKYDKGINGATGSKKYGYVYGKTASEVKQKLIKIEANIQQGVYIDRNALTVGNWLDIWMKEYKELTLKPSTYDSYQSIIKTYILPSIGGIKIQKLHPEHIQKMLNDLTKKGYAPRTVRYAHHVLSVSLNQAVKNGSLMKNPALSVDLPKQPKKEARALNKEEQKAFLDALKGDPKERAIKFILMTGLRVGEMIALTWDDVNLNKATIKTLLRINGQIVTGTPKTEKGKRELPLINDAIKLLKEQKKEQTEQKLQARNIWDDGNYIFTSTIGTPLDKDHINRTLHRICKKANIKPFSIHTLRHTFATRGLESGIDLRVMQELLGHSSLAMTADIYSHVLPHKKKENMQKIEGMFL